MTSRKRSGSGSSKRPKEKVVYIYELFFRGEDPTQDSPEFWNEFFLLQPNVECLEGEVNKLTSEQFVLIKQNLNMIFQKCIEILDTGKWQNEGGNFHILLLGCWGKTNWPGCGFLCLFGGICDNNLILFVLCH